MTLYTVFMGIGMKSSHGSHGIPERIEIRMLLRLAIGWELGMRINAMGMIIAF